MSYEEAIPARSLWLAAPREPEYRAEIAMPPGSGEVRVRTVASALSQGTEMRGSRGQLPPGRPLDLPALRGSFAFPIKYGYAAVGLVVDAGPGVQGLEAGD